MKSDGYSVDAVSVAERTPCHIGSIVDCASDGTIAAHREYDPFGGTVVAIGNADAFTHWFSTKPWCVVTGLSEYLYRNYSPALGRWLSRDPIGETGEANLYCFSPNAATYFVDLFGWLNPSLDDYVKRDFSSTFSASFGVGGGIKILTTRESAKHCCKTGIHAGEKREIIEWKFGPSINFKIGLNAQVEFLGVGVDVGFVGPNVTISLANVEYTSLLQNPSESSKPSAVADLARCAISRIPGVLQARRVNGPRRREVEASARPKTCVSEHAAAFPGFSAGLSEARPPLVRR